MFQKILIAYDGSDHSRRAARIAGNMARVQPKSEAGAGLRFGGHAQPVLGKPYIDNLITDRTREGELMLQQAREIIGDGRRCQFRAAVSARRRKAS